MGKIVLDRLGRIVIPVSIRKMLDLKEGSELDISVEDEKILLRLSSSLCKLCRKETVAYDGLGICKKCFDKIKNTTLI